MYLTDSRQIWCWLVAKVGINPKSNPRNPKSSPALEKDWKSKSNSQFHMEWKSKSNPRANPLVNTFNKKIFYGEPYDVLLDWDDVCFNKPTSIYHIYSSLFMRHSWQDNLLYLHFKASWVGLDRGLDLTWKKSSLFKWNENPNPNP